MRKQVMHAVIRMYCTGDYNALHTLDTCTYIYLFLRGIKPKLGRSLLERHWQYRLQCLSSAVDFDVLPPVLAFGAPCSFELRGTNSFAIVYHAYPRVSRHTTKLLLTHNCRVSATVVPSLSSCGVPCGRLSIKVSNYM